ncbi:leucine-rich repeats and immunoglobulin-like domains protein 3 [Nematostella vectensis]|uniref:leucine-rich repeats and immunoglobulin-like domains protein 3 n=1 Tax=Nematostella vectensis TaxID=45351 RepID=UPI0020774C18|nr:leucine-rich repeats and immunoglobulin-like domains protein 3 [Nematostella vectensis]
MHVVVTAILSLVAVVGIVECEPGNSRNIPRVLYCPAKCECSREKIAGELSTGILVNCTGRRLRNFPLPLPPRTSTLLLNDNRLSLLRYDFFLGLNNIRTLDLSGNRFSKIRFNTFGYLPGMKKLNLRRNGIKEIEFGAFRNLTALESLILSKNKLRRLTYAMFDTLSYLRLLDLSQNGINDVQPGAFVGLKSLSSLLLNDNLLTSIPSHLLPDLYSLKSLYLYRNRISEIGPNAFERLTALQVLSLVDNRLTGLTRSMFSGLKSLRELYLQRNQIQDIEPWTFTSLKSLASLYMYSNSLKKVEKNMFADLKALRVLHLGINTIQYIIDGSFRDLGNLLTLYLDSNQLTVISRDTLLGLTNVKDIHVYFNKLRYVARDAFKPNPQLTRIVWDVPALFRRTRPEFANMVGNMLHCDCNALWFRDWLISHAYTRDVTCQTPPRLKGVLLGNLNDSDIKCDPVVVTVSPKKKLVREWESVELYCNVNTGAVYTWTVNGSAVVLDDLHTINPLGTLQIASVSKLRDVGEYVCIARNAAGFGAASLELYIGVRPKFKTLPVPVEADEPGKPVLFKCSADGYPNPTISWKRDGLLITSSSTSNSQYQVTNEGALLYHGKKHFITKEGSLIIFDPSEDDEGSYTCEAANEVGKAIHRITLYVDISDKCRCNRGGVCRAKTYRCECTTGFHRIGDQCEEDYKPTAKPIQKRKLPTGQGSGDVSGGNSGSAESGSGSVVIDKQKPEVSGEASGDGLGGTENSGSGTSKFGESSGEGSGRKSSSGDGEKKTEINKLKPPIDQEESGDEIPTRPSVHRKTTHRHTPTRSATVERIDQESGEGSGDESGFQPTTRPKIAHRKSTRHYWKNRPTQPVTSDESGEESGYQPTTRPYIYHRTPTLHSSKLRPTTLAVVAITEKKHEASGDGQSDGSASGQSDESGSGHPHKRERTRRDEQMDWVPVEPEIYFERNES